ncbi:hypothetical protein GGR53DRAFT_494743 [Hypoxylon sp. FL1150]|nr:hypothetical protein GGR53DRAFT_494743 [Hypoxylon sp. FL1150]
MQYEGCVRNAYEKVEAWTSTSTLSPFGPVQGFSLGLPSKVVPALPQLVSHSTRTSARVGRWAPFGRLSLARLYDGIM